MTCIVGLVRNGKTYIGADSLGVDPRSLSCDDRKDPKVFRNGEFLIGFTTSYRMGQILAHSFSPPIMKKDQDLYTYMVTDFVDAVRKALKDGGFASALNGEETGGTFLVGYKDRLFSIESDYQVGESRSPFTACGCADALALGAVAVASELPDMTAEWVVKTAIQVASRFSAGVGGEIVILNTEA